MTSRKVQQIVAPRIQTGSPAKQDLKVTTNKVLSACIEKLRRYGSSPFYNTTADLFEDGTIKLSVSTTYRKITLSSTEKINILCKKIAGSVLQKLIDQGELPECKGFKVANLIGANKKRRVSNEDLGADSSSSVNYDTRIHDGFRLSQSGW